ncbi:Argininosuccinate synthase [Nymphon striatum]|nr:Argininosuccinate synthase [Nymphon striatum]
MPDVNPAAKANADINKVVLAYSGGLDTSVILKWLEVEYECEVVTFTADLGQGEELEPARTKAEAMGVKEIYIDDLREEFVRDFVYPMFRANAIYEGVYLLGTSIARPLIAKRLIEIARETGADAISHGATGKGNDQVRFELGAYALARSLRPVARNGTWRAAKHCWPTPDEHNIPIEMSPRRQVAVLTRRQPAAHQLRRRPSSKIPPTTASRKCGAGPVASDRCWPELNRIGGIHGIGRPRHGREPLRGYEVTWRLRNTGRHDHDDRSPSHRVDLPGPRSRPLPRYAKLIYNGFWWSPEREMLQAAIDYSQARVNGTVTLKLYKGNVMVAGRTSDDTLFDEKIATFEDDGGTYDQADAAGFIKLNALRLRNLARRDMR